MIGHTGNFSRMSTQHKANDSTEMQQPSIALADPYRPSGLTEAQTVNTLAPIKETMQQRPRGHSTLQASVNQGIYWQTADSPGASDV